MNLNDSFSPKLGNNTIEGLVELLNTDGPLFKMILEETNKRHWIIGFKQILHS